MGNIDMKCPHCNFEVAKLAPQVNIGDTIYHRGCYMEEHIDVQSNSLARQITSDGSTAGYYELPKDPNELYHLIIYKNMNAQIGEIFRACYRYGECSHSSRLRDAKKILFYAQIEIERLENLESNSYETRV